MKRNKSPQQWLAAALTGLALAFSAGSSWAVTDKVLGTFDTDLTGYNVWGVGWGPSVAAWDSAGAPGGSLYCSAVFNSTNSDTPVCYYAVDNGNPWWHPDPPYDLSQYKSIEFDLKWNNDPTNMPISEFNNPTGDPASWADSGLNIGAIWKEVTATVTNDGNNQTITNLPIPAAAASGWTHVSIPIDPTTPNITASYGIWIRKWICNPPATPGDWQTGHVITNVGTYGFWIDNVVLKGGEVLPPPTMDAPAKPFPGVNFIAASAGQYDRQEIRTVATNYSWIGASGPVTYSVDVTKIGEDDPAGFTLMFHWIPGGGNPTDPASDWTEPNILMWSIANNASGGGWGALNYKTNTPADNGHLYDTGSLGGVGSADYHGTWSITFENNTTVTMKSPDGSTFTTNLPPEVISIWSATPGMQVNIGCVNGELNRRGQKAVITGAKFTGTPSTINSDFLAAAPDTNIWRTVATSVNGVQWVAPTAPFWLSWSLPANGFGLQRAASATGSWTGLNVPTYDDAVGKRHALLQQSDLPGQNAGFYRLKKAAASKLQVLLPGETAAPFTTSGKTGSPIVQTNGVEFFVVINAVDDDWVVINSVYDQCQMSASGGFPVWTPSDIVNLTGGTATQSVIMNDNGTFTITATVTTAGSTIAAGTSSGVTVNP